MRLGMEASGQARWFERLISELRFELWIGNAAEIRTKRVRKQKTDRQNAQLILRLLIEDRFPRISVASWENRDLSHTRVAHNTWEMRFLRQTYTLRTLCVQRHLKRCT